MAISVEQLPDEGAPQVGITVDGLSSNAVISVQVSWDSGETWHGVRGAQRVTRTGSAFFRDFVPPLNVTAWYRVVIHSGEMVATWSGTLHPGMPGTYPSSETYPEPLQLVTGADAAITVTSDRAWIQDPLSPRTAVPVRAGGNVAEGEAWLTSDAPASVTWAQAVDEVTVEGSDLPVASVGIRQRAGDVSLQMAYEVFAEGGLLAKLLKGAGQLVVRGLPDDLLDPVAHVVVGDATERRFGSGQIATWDLRLRQTRPQSLRVVVPFFTYDQVKTIVTDALGAGTTYATVMTEVLAGTTYIDVQRDPRILTGDGA